MIVLFAVICFIFWPKATIVIATIVGIGWLLLDIIEHATNSVYRSGFKNSRSRRW